MNGTGNLRVLKTLRDRLALYAVLGLAALVWLEPQMMALYRQTYSVVWFIAANHLLRPMALALVGGALAVLVFCSFDAPPRMTQRGANLLLTGSLLAAVLFEILGGLYWAQGARPTWVVETVRLFGPLYQRLVEGGGWVFVLLGAAAAFAVCVRRTKGGQPASRRNIFFQNGGDPWLSPPYHRRSIGVDPDSKWDLGHR